MFVLFGPGIFCVATLEQLPKTGDELNFGEGIIREGVYRVVHEGTKKLKGSDYPYFTRRRVADLVPGAKTIPVAVLNC